MLFSDKLFSSTTYISKRIINTEVTASIPQDAQTINSDLDSTFSELKAGSNVSIFERFWEIVSQTVSLIVKFSIGILNVLFVYHLINVCFDCYCFLE